MDLPRTWMRALLGAGALGLLVPVALLVSVAVVGVGGGLGGISSLRQVIEGPSLDPPPPPGEERAQAELIERGAGAVRDVRVTGGTPFIDGVDREGPGRRGPRAEQSPPPPPPPSTSPPPPGVVQPPTPGTPPPPPRPPRRGPVRQLGDGLKGVTNALPAPLSNIGGAVIDTLVETVEAVLPPPGAPATSAAPAAPAG